MSYRMNNKMKGFVNIRGKEGYFFVGEEKVTLQRKSRENLQNASEVRLVISTVYDEQGKQLTKWYLLSNVMDVSSETLATGYYWR